VVEPTTLLTPLHRRLAVSLANGGAGLARLAEAAPVDQRDLLLTLCAIHDLHTAPIDGLLGAERLQHHPVIAGLKWRLEEDFLTAVARRDEQQRWDLPSTATAAMRAIAAIDLVPEVYDWLAVDASPQEIRDFLAVEGGPDGGFDDLVAACQIGLGGSAKLELAQNYWDEMGRGIPDRVHTELHHKLSQALGLSPPPRKVQLTGALERSVLSGVLATNRWLQPEMVGALGLLELQAGARCRRVVTALRRVGAGEDALDFYIEHATVDPRHGRDWVDRAVGPLADDPRWSEGMVRGARWRSLVNAGLFTALHATFTLQDRRAS